MDRQRLRLVFGGFLLLGGRAADLVGCTRIFLAGVVVFTVASLLNNLTPTSDAFVVFRGLQGLGAALVVPAALSMITTTFATGAVRTEAMGARAGSAVPIAAGFFAPLFLLNRRDVAAVSQGQVAVAPGV